MKRTFQPSKIKAKRKHGFKKKDEHYRRAECHQEPAGERPKETYR